MIARHRMCSPSNLIAFLDSFSLPLLTLWRSHMHLCYLLDNWKIVYLLFSAVIVENKKEDGDNP